MCYNFSVSVTTFVIGTLGTLYNLIAFRKTPIYVAISFFWMGAILMQLWESLLWKDNNCPLFTKLAKYTNLMQPILVLSYLLIPNYIKKNNINIPLVYLVIGFYVLTVFPMIIKDYNCVKTKNGITLKWWDKETGLIYIFTVLCLFKLLLRQKLFKYQSIFFVGGLLLAQIIIILTDRRKNIANWTENISSGHLGSIWCWVAAVAPFYNYFLFKNKF